MLKNKILSTILAVAFIGGGSTVAALTLKNTPSHPADSVSSEAISIVSSQTTSSKEESTVDDSITKINDVTSKSIDKINSTTSEAINEVKKTASSTASGLKKQMAWYGLVDPKTGTPISGSDPNYKAIQAELNAGCDVKDAGTVPPNQSKACQAALNRIKAAKAASSSAKQ